MSKIYTKAENITNSLSTSIMYMYGQLYERFEKELHETEILGMYDECRFLVVRFSIGLFICL